MAATRPTRRDTSIGIGEADAARIDRLVGDYGSKINVVREALLALELQQNYIQDAVREAVIWLAEAVGPDERYDPSDDPRSEDATLKLARVIGSLPAAQGIAIALRELNARKVTGG